MDIDLLLKALAEPTRRRLLDELGDADGQTLFELHARMVQWHGAVLSRQALSKHLAALEDAGLVRVEWRWKSKHHFLEREPLRRLWRMWLGPLAKDIREEADVEDRADERAGR